jgi:hypothetical protein
VAYVAQREEDDQTSSPSQQLQQSSAAAAPARLEKQGGTGGATSGQQGGAGPDQAAKSPGDFTRSKFTNASTLVQRNRNADTTTAASGRLVGDVAQQARRAADDVQGRARTYEQTQQDKIKQTYASPNEDMLQKALGGDKDADAAIRRARSQTAAGPVDNFDPGENTQLVSQDFFSNQEFAPLLQQRAGDTYTSGMAGLDNMFLNRGNAGQKVREQVAGHQKTVDDARTQAGTVQNRVQGFADEYLKGQRGQFEGLLGGRRQALDSTIQGRMGQAAADRTAKVEAERAAARQALRDRAGAKSQEVARRFDPIATEMYGSRDGYSRTEIFDRLGGMKDEELDKYIDVAAPELTEADVTSAEEADDYNQVLEYLGLTSGHRQARAPVQAKAAARGEDFDGFLNQLVEQDAGFAYLRDADAKKQEMARLAEVKNNDFSKVSGTGNNAGAAGNTGAKTQAPSIPGKDSAIVKNGEKVVDAHRSAARHSDVTNKNSNVRKVGRKIDPTKW